MKKCLFVGPDPKTTNINPGGQITSAKGIAQFAEENGIELTIIDSAQGSFPVPPVRERVKRAILRIYLLLRSVIGETYDGAILFSGSGMSLVEKACFVGSVGFGTYQIYCSFGTDFLF